MLPTDAGANPTSMSNDSCMATGCAALLWPLKKECGRKPVCDCNLARQLTRLLDLVMEQLVEIRDKILGWALLDDRADLLGQVHGFKTGKGTRPRTHDVDNEPPDRVGATTREEPVRHQAWIYRGALH